MKRNNLDGRNCIILPRVNKGSGLDDFGPRARIVPIMRNEQTAVRNPTPSSIFKVFKTDGLSDMTV
jgi:hypothetical protein